MGDNAVKSRPSRVGGGTMPAANGGPCSQRSNRHAQIAEWGDSYGLSPPGFDPIVSKCSQARQDFAVFCAVGRFLAADDVVGVTDPKALDLDVSRPGFGESFDSVRREYEVYVERAVLELDKVLTPLDVLDLMGRQTI